MGLFIRAALLLHVTFVSDILDFPATEGIVPSHHCQPSPLCPGSGRDRKSCPWLLITPRKWDGTCGDLHRSRPGLTLLWAAEQNVAKRVLGINPADPSQDPLAVRPHPLLRLWLRSPLLRCLEMEGQPASSLPPAQQPHHPSRASPGCVSGSNLLLHRATPSGEPQLNFGGYAVGCRPERWGEWPQACHQAPPSHVGVLGAYGQRPHGCMIPKPPASFWLCGRCDSEVVPPLQWPEPA